MAHLPANYQSAALAVTSHVEMQEAYIQQARHGPCRSATDAGTQAPPTGAVMCDPRLHPHHMGVVAQAAAGAV